MRQSSSLFAGAEKPLGDIFSNVFSKTGIDLRHYKPPTIHRRIQRRIMALKLGTLEKYAEFVAQNLDEAEILAAECMIQVTNFFRDPRVYTALSRKVLPALLENRDAGDPLRIWVPGCATGEEVYSIAIALSECMARSKLATAQIFGTDLDENALAVARRGIYPARIAKSVPAKLLPVYFSESRKGYEVSKSIRSLCTFARQDLTVDPPFSRLDLISCRNVLIYIADETQNRIFSLFHYGLKPGGFLMLGKSEAIGSSFPELFSVVDRKANLYQRRSAATRAPVPFPKAGPPVPAPRRTTAPAAALPSSGLDFDREIDHALIGALSPSMVVVNDALDVIQIRGDVSRFLRFPHGKLSFSLMKVAREEMAATLKLAIDIARRKSHVVRRSFQFKDGRRSMAVDVEVRPLLRSLFKEWYFMILFRERAIPHAGRAKAVGRRSMDYSGGKVHALQQELASTRSYLQSIVEDNERTNQALRSANEEILSSNEELQSTNEELQTAKEELESTNEELTTVNEELEIRNAELKRSFAELSVSQKELGEAQAIANLGSWVWTAGEKSFHCSDELFRILGLSPQSGPISYERFIGLLHPEDRERVDKVFQAAIKKASRFSIEHRIVRPDGTVRVVQARGDVSKTGEGAAVRLHGTAQDVTEARAAEASLRASEQRFRLLVEEVGEYAIFLLDLKGNIVSWNIGAQRLKGYRSDEVIGKHFSMFYAEEDRRNGIPDNGLKSALADGRWVSEGWRYRKNGSRFWANVVITALKDESGKVFGFSKITRDMTERKEAEEELKEAHATLEHRVAERTRELKENEARLIQKTRELQKAQKDLRQYAAELRESNEHLLRTNQELEQFAYVASHDLQEPLRKISNNSDLLVRKLGDRIDGDGQKHIKQIVGGVERMYRLINDLLQFSRAARDSSGREPVNLSQEVRRAIENLPEASIADIHVGQLPTVMGHPMRLRQVFQNLIGNAIKFRRDEKPKVSITASREENGWKLCVSDNGIGVEPQYRDRIFVIFQRLHTSETYPGTGIGLAICKKIVEASGGRIWVESNAEGGSSFCFTWPDPVEAKPSVDGSAADDDSVKYA